MGKLFMDNIGHFVFITLYSCKIYLLSLSTSSIITRSHGLTTYKELCSLASDLNQPDLVYKFMNLANHHAMWNSRKVFYLYVTVSIISYFITHPVSPCV